VRNWRYYYKLKYKLGARVGSSMPCVSFRDALLEEKHDKMLMFLCLVDKCKPEDVRGFITAYRENVGG